MAQRLDVWDRTVFEVRLKRFLLHISKWLGLFKLAEFKTRHGLRILGYHGFAIADEAGFRQRLFMDPDTFRGRLNFLSRRRIPVLSLDEAIDRLSGNGLPPCATVITVDDGFYGTYRCAFKHLAEFSFPATVYVTTYYLVKNMPIFRLVVSYMFWKSDKVEADLSDLYPAAPAAVNFSRRDERERVIWEIIRYGETKCSEEERQAMLKSLGVRLDVDYKRIEETRILSLVRDDEIREMMRCGIDIQLHTHRHRLPLDEELVSREIEDNRSVLEVLAGRPLNHFCYPDGVWSAKHLPWLEKLGIKSACTCDRGLSYKETPRLALRRLNDSSDRSLIEFEADFSGYMDLLRSVRSVLRRVRAR